MFRKAAHYLHHKLCSASLLGNTQSFGHCVERQAKGVTIHVRQSGHGRKHWWRTASYMYPNSSCR